MKTRILLGLLVACFMSGRAMAAIDGVSVNSNSARAGEEVVITVAGDATTQNRCGLSVEFGDGEVRDIKIEAKEGLFPRTLTKVYAKPGSFAILVKGKSFFRGFNSYSACEGNAAAAVTVASAADAVSRAAVSPQANTDTKRNLVVKTNASAGKRLALVIGNGSYQNSDSLPKLANPTHDAEDIAKALRGFGFEVIERKDQSLEGMSDAITEFSRKIGDSEAALFYFAGHGLQVKGQNYIIPIDAKIETEAQVPFKSINVNLILEEMENGKSRANIVMLDACRNNPISGKFRSGVTRGLAAPTNQPKGTVIVYATDPGNVAADGDGRNGLFTAGLLTAFKGGDLSLHGVLVRASKEVERGSDKKQTPYINGPATLQEEFQFAPSQATQIASLEPAPAQKPVKNLEEIEQETWESARDSANINVIQEYLKQYPKGRFAGQAKVRIVALKSVSDQATQAANIAPSPVQQTAHVKSRDEIEQEAWKSARDSASIGTIQEYLKQYPNGRFSGQAKVLIATLATVAEPIVSREGENALWNEVQKGNSKDDYNTYLMQYPKGRYVVSAKSRIRELQREEAAEIKRKEQSAWEIANRSGSEGGYQSYLKDWPAGQYAVLAQVRLQKLQTNPVVRQEQGQEEQEYWQRALANENAQTMQAYLDRYPNGNHAATAQERLTAILKTEAKADAENGKMFNVGHFSATKPGEKVISCRGLPLIRTADGKPFSEFVRQLFLDDLKMSNIYSSDAATTLSGNLDAIDVNSFGGVWHLALTVKSSNGKSLTISENHSYITSLDGDVACKQAIRAFRPAVKNLIGNIRKSPEFATLMAQ